MQVDRTRRNVAGPRPSGRADGSVRDTAAAKSGPRDVVVVNSAQTPTGDSPSSTTPKATALTAKPSRYADALFLAHLFASKFDAPQQREKRRAEPADANASYRKSMKPPARPGRVLSKKV